MLTKFQNWLAKKKEQRFLKKHNCRSWAQYNREYDPRFSPKGLTVNEMYFGYTVIVPITNVDHEIYTHWGPGISLGLERVSEWCTKHCRGPWRCDWHRVSFNPQSGKYEQNGIWGDDLVFFAFVDPVDATLFNLRW